MRPHRMGIFAYILGYFDILIPRVFCEPFLNLCMRYGFTYYSLSLDENEGILHVRAPLSQRRRIICACRAWQIRIRAGKTMGLPKHLGRLRGRWGMLIGAVLGIALILLSQSVLWRIDVVGNDTVETEHVLELLSENGISVGARISDIATESAEQRIMMSEGDIAWISVNIRGTVAHVEIREQVEGNADSTPTKPANLVSNFDAQIVSLEVYSGFVSVKEGDLVHRGDLLVSGIYKTENAPARYTRAVGSVIGRVRCTFEVHIPLTQTEKVPTGEKFSQKTLIFFGKTIKLFTNCGKIPPTCDIISCKYTPNPLSLGELPVSLTSTDYYPYEEWSVRIGEAEAIEQAYRELYSQIENALPEAQILKKEISGELREDEYVLCCTVSALCNIARCVEIEIDDVQ